MTNFIIWMLESSLLILMIYGIRKIFMGKVRYAVIAALWLVVFARLLVPVSVGNIPFSIGNIAAKAGFTLEQMSDQTSVGADTASGTMEMSAGAAGISSVMTRMSEVPQVSVSQIKRPSTENVSPGSTGAAVSDQKAVVHTENAQRNGQLFWLVSALLVSGSILFVNQIQMRKFRRNRIFWGKKGRLCIYRVSGLKSPCLYGCIRPAIYLPEQIVQMSEDEVEQMILHEYVHYRHGDHIWSFLRVILLSVYWFHPLVWLAVSVSRKDAELFCDESVIRRLGDDARVSYGMVLIRMAAERKPSDLCYTAVPMSKKGEEMERRIRAICQRKVYSRWMVIPVIAAVVLICGFTGGKRMEAKTAEPNTEQTAAAQKTTAEGMTFRQIQNVAAVPAVPMELRYQNMGFLERPQISVFSSDQDVRECRQVYQRYITTFIHAVNTGNTDTMSLVLKKGSSAYQEQTALVQNYYKRGIRENIDLAVVIDAVAVSSDQVQVQSNEKIRVSSDRSEARLVNQSYCYTCERINGKWLITDMTKMFF